MELKGEACLLRVFFGEADKVGHTPLHEVIVREARARGMAGSTVWRGVLGYGRSSRIRSAKILDLSSDLPLICEIVDDEAKTTAFLEVLHDLFEKAKCGGMVTHESVHVVKYTSAAHTTAQGDKE